MKKVLKLLTWFIRRIVPLVIAASTHTTRNKVGGFVHILKKLDTKEMEHYYSTALLAGVESE